MEPQQEPVSEEAQELSAKEEVAGSGCLKMECGRDTIDEVKRGYYKRRVENSRLSLTLVDSKRAMSLDLTASGSAVNFLANLRKASSFVERSGSELFWRVPCLTAPSRMIDATAP
jgi:hypothetical protein